MVHGSGSDGPQPGGRSDAFPARSPDGPSSGPDGPSSGPDGPRWRMVVFFSLYGLDIVLWGSNLRVLRVSRSPGTFPDNVESPKN
jgi:hypothetical protein